MTTVLTEDGNKGSLMRQKLRGIKVDNEENRSFLRVSRENLSISHSDLEQGFNKSRIRPNKNTILSLLAILCAAICVTIEIWKLQKVFENARDIKILKRDVETLKHRFLEEGLLDELKAFEEQLYAEDSNEDLDYDSNYDDDYSEDYSTDSGNGQENRQNVSNAGSDKDLKETLTALYAAEAKRGEEFEKNVRENRKNIEREKLLKENQEYSKRKSTETETHTTRKRSVQNVQSYNESQESVSDLIPLDELQRKNESKLKYLPKKYVTQEIQQSHTYLSPVLEAMKNENEDETQSEETPANKKEDKRILMKNNQIAKRRKNVQVNEIEQKIQNIREKNEVNLRLQRREMTTPRHLRSAKQVYAVHYEADSTLFSSGDEHTGNGRAKHNADVFKAWRPSSWVQEFNLNNHFSLSDGRVTIHESGLYLAYAQIHYLDEHDENGFQMLVNERPLFQCMVYSPGFEHKSRSCFSSQVTVLKSGDHVMLRDVGTARYTLFQRDKSFFGLVKLADIRQPQRHQLASSSTTVL